MHPYNRPTYEADVRSYEPERHRFIEWRCPTCRKIFDWATNLNAELDEIQWQIHRDSPWPDIEVQRLNDTLIDPEHFPFPWPETIGIESLSRYTSVDTDSNKENEPPEPRE